MHVNYDELDYLNKKNNDLFIPKSRSSDAPYLFNEFLAREHIKQEFFNTSQNLSNNQTNIQNEFGNIDNDQAIKIDIRRMITTYLIEFIRLVYIEAKSKFPKDDLI